MKLFLKLSGIPSELAQAGVELRRQSGDIYTATAPLENLPQIAEIPQVISMEGVRKVKPLLDISVPDISADQVWTHSRWGNQGEGVVVGMVDTGIFYEHEAFRDEEGNSRVLYIWDNTTNSECDPASIQDRSCGATDGDGHGTAVMGVIAGAGSEGCQQNEACVGRGVAPKASIVVVKMDEEDEQELAEGVAYIFEKAAELGMPAVVNVSWGNFGGPLDGSSDVEEFISNQTGPGRIVVAAAGDEALRRAHATPLSQGTYERAVTFVDGNVSPIGNLPLGEIFGWYDFTEGDSTDIEVRVLAFENEVTGWVGFGGSEVDAEDPTGDWTGTVSLDHTGESSNARGFHIKIENADTIQWQIQIRRLDAGQDAVKVDLWIDQPFPNPLPPQGLAKFRFTVDHRDEWQRKTVMSPCTADEVICVASYNTRCDIQGACNEQGEGEGTISAFSSIGPRRNGGRGWPFIAAPGTVLTASIGGESDYDYAGVGTSFSSPHVAGTVALMLAAEARAGQDDPRLTPTEVRDALKYTQDVEAEAGERPVWKDDEQGWGKLDALKAVDEAILPLPPPPPPTPQGLGGDDDFCFIATAVFGGIDSPQVERLREVRDHYLLKTSLGRRFVRFYYRWSPPVAAWLKERAMASRMVRLSLMPLVGIAEVARQGSGSASAVLAGFGLFLVSAVCYSSLKRRIR